MAFPTTDHHLLVERAKHGEKLALQELLVTYSGHLTKHISRRVPNSLERVISVEDITQEAMMFAFSKIHTLRTCSINAFVAWLKAIGELTLLRMVKAEKRQKRGRDFDRLEYVRDANSGKLLEFIEMLPSNEGTASHKVARREAIAAMQVCLASLPNSQRQAIELHFLRGKTLDETAKTMQRTPAAVRSLIHRGKENLAEAMGRASLWLSRSG